MLGANGEEAPWKKHFNTSMVRPNMWVLDRKSVKS